MTAAPAKAKKSVRKKSSKKISRKKATPKKKVVGPIPPKKSKA